MIQYYYVFSVAGSSWTMTHMLIGRRTAPPLLLLEVYESPTPVHRSSHLFQYRSPTMKHLEREAAAFLLDHHKDLCEKNEKKRRDHF